MFCLKFSGSITACFSARAVKKNKQTTKNKKPQKLLEQLFKLKEKKKKRLPFFYFAFVFGPKKKIDQAGPIFSVATKVMRRKKTVFGLILLIFQCKLREGKSDGLKVTSRDALVVWGEVGLKLGVEVVGTVLGFKVEGFKLGLEVFGI